MTNPHELACPLCWGAGKWHSRSGQPCHTTYMLCDEDHTRCMFCHGNRRVIRNW